MADRGATDSSPYDPAAHGWALLPAHGFSSLVGPMWTRQTESGRRLGFVAEARHENSQGAVHGGMLMTFADHAIGLGAWEAAGRRPCVTMQLDTQFVAAVRRGDFVECRPHLIRLGRSVIFMRADMTVSDRCVLTANGIWKIIG